MANTKAVQLTLLVAAALILQLGLTLALISAFTEHLQGLVGAGVTALAAISVGWTLRRNKLPLISPVSLVCIPLLGTSLLGQFLYSFYADDSDPSKPLLDLPDFAYTATVFAIAVIGVVLGQEGYFLMLRALQRDVLAAGDSSNANSDFQSSLIVASLPLAFGILASGVGPLLSRDTYLFAQRGGYSSLAAPLALAGVLMLGALWQRADFWVRLTSIAIALTYFLYIYALGSRLLCILPVAFALGLFLSNSARKGVRLLVYVSPIISFLLLPIPLYDRGLNEHGLIPYINALPDIFSVPTPYSDALNNLIAGFHVTGITAAQPRVITDSVLGVELNPLPGDVAGWYDISAALRVNQAVPFASLGELANNSLWTLFLAFVVVGVVAARVTVETRKTRGVWGLAYAAAAYGLLALFAVVALQYNLRSSSRLILYLIELEIVRTVVQNSTARDQRMPSLLNRSYLRGEI